MVCAREMKERRRQELVKCEQARLRQRSLCFFVYGRFAIYLHTFSYSRTQHQHLQYKIFVYNIWYETRLFHFFYSVTLSHSPPRPTDPPLLQIYILHIYSNFGWSAFLYYLCYGRFWYIKYGIQFQRLECFLIFCVRSSSLPICFISLWIYTQQFLCIIFPFLLYKMRYKYTFINIT